MVFLYLIHKLEVGGDMQAPFTDILNCLNTVQSGTAKFYISGDAAITYYLDMASIIPTTLEVRIDSEFLSVTAGVLQRFLERTCSTVSWNIVNNGILFHFAYKAITYHIWLTDVVVQKLEVLETGWDRVYILNKESQLLYFFGMLIRYDFDGRYILLAADLLRNFDLHSDIFYSFKDLLMDTTSFLEQLSFSPIGSEAAITDAAQKIQVFLQPFYLMDFNYLSSRWLSKEGAWWDYKEESFYL